MFALPQTALFCLLVLIPFDYVYLLIYLVMKADGFRILLVLSPNMSSTLGTFLSGSCLPGLASGLQGDAGLPHGRGQGKTAPGAQHTAFSSPL